MERLEKVEKIREKTGVSYEEADKALKACGDDILDAIIYLENLGSIERRSAGYSSNAYAGVSPEMERAQMGYEKSVKDSSFGDNVDRFINWVKKVLKKSIDTTFVIDRKNDRFLGMPVLILVLALIFMFPVTVVLLIVGLFLDCRYRFEGVDEVRFDINGMLDKAADGAESLKRDVNNKKNNDM